MKLCSVTKVKVLFLVLVYVLNLADFNVFEFSAAMSEKGLFDGTVYGHFFVVLLSNIRSQKPITRSLQLR